MRVLQLIPSLNNGGAERFVCEFSNELRRSFDVQCDIALMYGDEEFSNNLKSSLDGIECWSMHKKPGFSLSYLFSLCKLIRKNGYDVVHAHLNCITYLLLSAFVLRDVKFIATIHSDARFEAPGFIDKLVRKILFRSRRVTPVTISEESEKSFYDYYDLNAKIIYNGLSRFQLPEISDVSIRKSSDDLIFIHPASCQPVKNQKLLLSVFKRITRTHKNVRLYWFGSNEANRELFDEMTAYFSDNIRYMGCVNNLRDYLYQADAMCLSSLIEGMPMVIIESFSVGCIPLVTPAGGCVNMIEDGYNGFVSGGFDENSYYEMIERFIALSLKEKERMSENSSLSFKTYDISECVKSYLDVYECTDNRTKHENS